MRPKNLMAVLMIIVGAISIAYTFVWGAGLISFRIAIPVETWVMGVLKIGVGVGLLCRMRWARWVAVGYCVLTVIVAIIGPILALLTSKYIALVASFFLGNMPLARGAVFVIVALQIGYGYLAWVTYKYLRSDEGLEEFGERQPDNALAQVVYATAIWLSLPFVLPSSYVPPYATAPSARATPKVNISDLAERGFLTTDGQHMVFMASNVRDLYLLDLQSGKLARTMRHAYVFPPDANITSRMVAPDASAIIYPDGTFETLPGGSSRSLTSFGATQRSVAVGFASNDRLLAYHDSSGNLELIDPKADRILWSVKLPGVIRAPSQAGVDTQLAMRSSAWSPRRDQFAWADGGSAYVVNLSTGSVREIARTGLTSLFVMFSPDGSELLVSPISGYAMGAAPPAHLVDLASGQSTEVPVEGTVLYFGGRGGDAISVRSYTRELVRQPVMGTARSGREVPVSSPYSLDAANAGGFVFGYGAEAQPIFALVRDDEHLPMWRFDSRTHYRTARMSLDGRTVALAARTRIEVYDTASLLAGAPKRRSIDLANEDRLSSPQPVQVEGVATLKWTTRAPE
jgi:hypothetical protein